MDDLECEVADEKFHKRALGHDILAADLNGEDALLLNIRVYRVFCVAHDIGCLICGERVGKVSEPLLNVVSECISALVGDLDIAVRNPHGVRRMMTTQHHRLLRRLGVEDTHGYLLAPLCSFLLLMFAVSEFIYETFTKLDRDVELLLIFLIYCLAPSSNFSRTLTVTA